ncbi:hypothetical protein [Mesorhizobium sp. A623]
MIMRLYGINGLDTVVCDLSNDGFYLEHISYDIENRCTADWFCEKHDVEVDEIGDDVMAADEFCHACPRHQVYSRSATRFVSGSLGPWNSPGDAQQQIHVFMRDQVAQNGFYRREVRELFQNPWSLEVPDEWFDDDEPSEVAA